MGDIRAEPKPGTALRIMVEEHRRLDEFMEMVKAKSARAMILKRYLHALGWSWMKNSHYARNISDDLTLTYCFQPGRAEEPSGFVESRVE